MNPRTIGIVLAIVLIVVAITVSTSSTSPRDFGIPEGASVRCDDGTGMIYRFTGGQLRYYPHPNIAAKWNPNWASNIINLERSQCDAIPKGPVME
jgi:hypothetical protein